MKSVLLSLLVILFGLSPVLAVDVVGLSLPLKGRFAPVAERMEFGALMAGEMLKKSGKDIEIISVDDGCDEDTAAETAKKLIDANVKIVVGPLCFKLATALTKELNKDESKQDPIPVITFNDQNSLLSRLRLVEELPLFSLSNSSDAEALAAVKLLIPQFSGKPFAILDDGSVYGRALADAVRLIGEEAGFKPIAKANFRPLQSNQISLLKRLQKSGVEALFIAAAAEDISTVAKDMKALGFDWQIATGEQGKLLPYTANAGDALNGLLMVSEAPFEVKQQRPDLAEKDAENSLLAGYALIEIAAQVLSSKDQKIAGQTFDTVIGPLSFDVGGRAVPSDYIVQKWQNGGFVDEGEQQ